MQLLLERREQAAQRELVALADGDARRMLNVLEVAAQLGTQKIEAEHINRAAGSQMRRFDKGATFFMSKFRLCTNLFAAAADAALYWFCRMLTVAIHATSDGVYYA